MATGPFDDPRGDRQSLGQGLVISQPLLIVFEVVGGLVHRLTLALAQWLAGGGPAQSQRYLLGPALEHGLRPLHDPALARCGGLGV